MHSFPTDLAHSSRRVYNTNNRRNKNPNTKPNSVLVTCREKLPSEYLTTNMSGLPPARKVPLPPTSRLPTKRVRKPRFQEGPMDDNDVIPSDYLEKLRADQDKHDAYKQKWVEQGAHIVSEVSQDQVKVSKNDCRAPDPQVPRPASKPRKLQKRRPPPKAEKVPKKKDGGGCWCF
jgi:hypothetical protein